MVQKIQPDESRAVFDSGGSLIRLLQHPLSELYQR